jgi:pantoate--beta-alanine ligase
LILVAGAGECRQALTAVRKKYAIGFVPTMGALHEGHLSLVQKSRSENPFTVMSLYVNPTQFGVGEDFGAYPRTPEKDRELAEQNGVDLLWTPTDRDIYPQGFSTFIEETSLSQHFCGRFRSGHFRGVCTVVYHLLRTVEPDRMYLGRKDAQQLRVLEKMAEDLALGVKVVGCTTVREKDGLARSSRNAYLTHQEREIAPALYAALSEAQNAFRKGERGMAELVSIVNRALARTPQIRVQYAELRRWSDFETPERVDAPSVLAVAAFLGKTRLIDNIFLQPGELS